MQARESIIPLSSFVQIHHGNHVDAESLIQVFLSGQVPSAQYFPKAVKYTAKNYVDREVEAPLAGALGTYLESALQKAFLSGYLNCQFDVKTKRQMIDIFNRLYGTIPTDKESNAKIYLLSHAAFYDFTRAGSCSYRSSYAALQLFKIFQATSLKVALQSAPTFDQFTVLIGNKQQGYYVYDALTNPLMVFDREFYIKNILPTFSKADYIATAMNMQITSDLFDSYVKQLSTIKEEFTKLLATSEKNPDVLLKDPAFEYCMRKNNIARREMKNKLVQAIETALTIVDNPQATCKK